VPFVVQWGVYCFTVWLTSKLQTLGEPRIVRNAGAWKAPHQF
jgi:hypothetical protein